jgi:hypothetical protein
MQVSCAIAKKYFMTIQSAHNFVIARSELTKQSKEIKPDCFAPLAMTGKEYLVRSLIML